MNTTRLTVLFVRTQIQSYILSTIEIVYFGFYKENVEFDYELRYAILLDAPGHYHIPLAINVKHPKTQITSLGHTLTAVFSFFLRLCAIAIPIHIIIHATTWIMCQTIRFTTCVQTAISNIAMPSFLCRQNLACSKVGCYFANASNDAVNFWCGS